MNTLIIGAPDKHVTDKLCNHKFLNVKFLINNLVDCHQDLNTDEIIKSNINETFKFKISGQDQINYQNFFEKNFNIFSFQFMRRGSKTLDIYELRNFFAYFYYSFFNILKTNKIELIIFFSLPHLGYDLILYELAKILKIKTILMHPCFIPKKYFMIKDIDDLGYFDKKTKSTKTDKNIIKNLESFRDNYIQQQKESNLAFRKKNKKIKLDARFFKKLILRVLIKLKIIYRDDINAQEKRYKFNLNLIEHSLENILKKKQNKKIIFVPLHRQPELSTSLFGGNYEDQILIIERLSIFSKDNWIVVVKENPFQTSFQRDKFFFKRLNYLKNVFFVDSTINSKSILDISDLTASVAGTIGFETLLQNKKTLVFGNAWYKNCHGVLKVNDKTTDEEILSFASSNIEKSKIFDDLYNIISSCYDGLIHVKDNKHLYENFDHDENSTLIVENIYNFIKKNFNKEF